MNPLTNVRNQQKINERELSLGVAGTKSSWHQQYKDSAWIYVGGLPFELTEGDIICIFSQYGEIVNINLVRDKSTGKSKGFCFLCYEDQRSTILAVDNLNSTKVLGRILRVDHVANYRLPKETGDEDDITQTLRQSGCAPQPVIVGDSTSESRTHKEKSIKEKQIKKEPDSKNADYESKQQMQASSEAKSSSSQSSTLSAQRKHKSFADDQNTVEKKQKRTEEHRPSGIRDSEIGSASDDRRSNKDFREAEHYKHDSDRQKYQNYDAHKYHQRDNARDSKHHANISGKEGNGKTSTEQRFSDRRERTYNDYAAEDDHVDRRRRRDDDDKHQSHSSSDRHHGGSRHDKTDRERSRKDERHSSDRHYRTDKKDYGSR